VKARGERGSGVQGGALRTGEWGGDPLGMGRSTHFST